MNNTQVQTTLAPLIAAIAGFLAGKGVFGLDSETWIAILGGAFAFGATIWGALAARQKTLTAQVGAFDGTKVVAPPEIANAIPSNDVVSNTEHKVVSK